MAKKRNKFWVGVKRISGDRQVFGFPEKPTQASHGHLYGYAIGPFFSRDFAQWWTENCYESLLTISQLAKIYKENRATIGKPKS